MRPELLAKPKVLVPLVFLLWLVVSLPLSVSQAGPISDNACDPSNPTKGVWGQGDSPAHLTALNACYKVSGTMVWGEWWRDKPQDCDLTNSQTAYNTCSDSDKNWYMRLNSTELSAAGVTSGEIKNLQRWGQCKAGYTDPAKWCNFLTETIPAGGNYGDANPTDDKPLLLDPCLDKDWGGQPITVQSCKGKNIQIQFTGTLATDNNHGWKEVHPVRKEKWTDSIGTHICSAYTADNQNCGDTTAPVVKAPVQSFRVTSQLGTSTVPVKLTWSATDNTGGSGIASYTLQRSINGGAYSNVTLPSATTTTITPSLTPNYTYSYRVAAKDKAGNVSAWAEGPSFQVTAYQESSSEIVDTGTWTTSALSGAYGGYVQYASTLGTNATFTIPAGSKNVEWVSTKAPNRGRAQVWLDGIQQDAKPSLTGIQPFDLYASSTQLRRAVFSKAVDPTISHTLEVRVLGQKNTYSTGTQVDIDAFVTTN